MFSEITARNWTLKVKNSKVFAFPHRLNESRTSISASAILKYVLSVHVFTW